MRNEQVTLTGTLLPPRVRSVTLQRRLDAGAWSNVRTQTSRSDGAFVFTVSAQAPVTAARISYRVTTPAAQVGGTQYPALETPAVVLDLVGQVAWLDTPTRVRQASTHELATTFYPPRPGRPVQLQRQATSGTWQQVAAGVQAADGSVTFSRPTTTIGASRYRAVAPAYRGAAWVATNAERVQVVGATGDVTPPPVPGGLEAVRSGAGAELSWSAVATGDLSGYRVYRGVTESGPWTRLTATPIADTAYVDTSTIDPVRTWYAVTSVDTLGNESSRSPVSQPSDDTTAPPIPTGLDGSAGDGRLDLDWDDVVAPDLAGYRVYGGAGAGGPWQVLADDIAESHHSLGGLDNGRTYWLAVTSIDEHGNESDRSSVLVLVPSDDTAPGQPGGVSVAVGDDDLVVSWAAPDPPADDLSGYLVFRGPSSSGPWTRITDDPIEERTLHDGDVETGTTYWYAVRAVDDDANQSPLSDAASGILPDTEAPAAPTGLVATPGDAQVALSWEAVDAPDLAGYRVYRSYTDYALDPVPVTGILTGTSHVDTALFNDYSVRYDVRAVDTAGNVSGPSDSVVVTPTAPAVNEIIPGITSGQRHTCRVKANGTAWCWGYAGDELGRGSSTSTTDTAPAGQVLGVGAWSSVSAGEFFTCGVKVSGTAWCWGYPGYEGRLGTSSQYGESYPRQLGTGRDWVEIDAGRAHACGVRTTGTLWCWGGNDGGQLGDGTTTNRAVPVQVGSATDWADVDAGTDHTCAIRTDRTLWCWGQNWSGQLGDGTTQGRLTPTQVGTGADWDSVTTGSSHTCGLRSGGAAWCWGNTNSGAVGLGPATSPYRVVTPTLVDAATWTTLTAGNATTCGTRDDGTLWCWGDNSSGKIGDGTLVNRNVPTQVGVGEMWAAVSPGEHHTCATRDDGTAWCWGEHSDGELGDLRSDVLYEPAPAGNGAGFTQVVGGGSHGCGLRDDGSAWCWGYNGWRQLGRATSGFRDETGRVGTASDWTDLTAGYLHTCGLRGSGTAWCWGYNSDGQVGSSTPNGFAEEPLRVGDATDWADLSAGYQYTCGRRDDGTAWCWGDGDLGQLGNGGTSDSPVPVQVAGEWAAVEAGFFHSCGIKVDGTAWCWGYNQSGQLGDGTLTTRTTPVQVGSATDWVSLAVGGNHTCGTRGDGTAWCWGNNYSGELGNTVGNGSNTPQATPVQVGSATDWTSISAGVNHTCGTRAGNTGWCWGDGWFGTIGNGPVPAGQLGGATPVTQVPGEWLRIDAAHQWTAALAGDGTVWGWGMNGAGQSGQLPISRTPVAVQE